MFVEVLLHGRRTGHTGAPVAFEAKLGWVLAGTLTSCAPSHVAAHHVALTMDDDVLCKFWEIEEHPKDSPDLSPEEQAVVKHFKVHHSRSHDGRFIVPLPKQPHFKPLGESRSQAVRRFLSLE